MAQNQNSNKFIDVHNSIVKTSSQRVRNILTLDEKIAVIKAYEQRPKYKKVARMFNCSWEQIKNIITNRAAIMEFYHAAKSNSKYESQFKGNTEDEIQLELKQTKIKFLGECVYECIQRLQYHAKLPITEELIRHKALEFLDVLRIPGFFPTKKWLNVFKATYNFSLSNKQICIQTEPHSSLDIKDIMTYCTRTRTSKCLITKYKNHEEDAKRMRKLNFLQEALKEYLLRVKFHHKSIQLNAITLRQVAHDLNEILKVPEFEPTTQWIYCFRKKYDNNECLVNAKRPPLNLDLKDILSYCSRMQNRTKDNAVTLAPKETALQMRILPKHPGNNITEISSKFQQSQQSFGPYIDEETGEKDIKPDIEEIRVHKTNLEQPPPLKIRKIESINNDPELQYKIPANIEMRKVSYGVMRHEPPKEPVKPAAKTIIYIQKVGDNSPKENLACLTPQPPNVQIKREVFDDSNYILPTNTIMSMPQLKIQQVHQLDSSSSLSPNQHHSPPTNSSRACDDNDSEELPRHVASFKDVLLLLKPLEEYAMLKENYRAIGLITQLEEVLKNDPEPSTGDDEFIG